MNATTRPLADLAEQAGFGMADVAHLAGVQESTVSRLWHDDRWLDRIQGRTLQSLVAVIPGLLDYLRDASTARRFDGIVTELATAGITVDTDAVDRLILSGEAAEETVGSALMAASQVVRGDSVLAAKSLTRCWGRDLDAALHYVFDTGADGLLVDPVPLLTAAEVMAEDLRPKVSSPNSFLARATLVHHSARSTGATITDETPTNARQAAFLRRSTAIGLIIANDDHDLVDAYAREVAASPVAQRVELWALPSYCRDVRAAPDFWVPKGTKLVRTATEVIHELTAYPDAYTRYLVDVFLTHALSLDPQFGGRLTELHDALTARRERTDHPGTVQCLDALANHLPRTP